MKNASVQSCQSTSKPSQCTAPQLSLKYHFKRFGKMVQRYNSFADVLEDIDCGKLKDICLCMNALNQIYYDGYMWRAKLAGVAQFRL